jgi:cytochrome c5
MKKLNVILSSTALIVLTTTNAQEQDGATTYRQVCSSCHETAAAGAPKLDDEEDWKPRIARGMNELYASIHSGKCQVYVKDLRKDLSDEMIMTTVDYMVSQVQQKNDYQKSNYLKNQY